MPVISAGRISRFRWRPMYLALHSGVGTLAPLPICSGRSSLVMSQASIGLEVLSTPSRAIAREAGRYAGMAGFQPGMQALYRIKIVVILVYAVSVIGLWTDREARRDPGIKTLLWLWTVYFLCMTFYENTKEVKYAIHIVTLFDAVAAVWIVRWWRRGSVRQLTAVVCAALFVFTGLGGLLYTSLVKNDYHRSFLPAAMFLKRTAAPRDLILAGSEFGFALGFDSNIVDDDAFTFDSHKAPDFIVIGNGYREFLDHSRSARPEVYSYFENLLARNYTLVYSHAGFDIFESRAKAALKPASRSGSG